MIQIMLIPAQSMQVVDGVHFDTAQVLAVLIGTVLPLLAGLITRWNASPGARAVVLLVLAAVTSFLTELYNAVVASATFDVGATLLTVLATFLVGVGVHFGLWSPTGASNAVKQSGGFIGGSSSSRSARDGNF
jgi:hypothetical protein